MRKVDMAKRTGVKFFRYFAIWSFAFAALYFLWIGQGEGNRAIGIPAIYLLTVLAVLIWLTARVYKQMFSYLRDIKDKYGNLEKLLLDIRDGKRTFYKEKRKFQRIGTEGSVNTRILNKNMDKFLNVINISHGGALLGAHQKIFTTGEIVDLNMYLPIFPQSIDVKAKVVRVDPVPSDKKNQNFNVGIEYLNMTRPDREKLDETVRLLSKSRGEEPIDIPSV